MWGIKADDLLFVRSRAQISARTIKTPTHAEFVIGDAKGIVLDGKDELRTTRSAKRTVHLYEFFPSVSLAEHLIQLHLCVIGPSADGCVRKATVHQISPATR